MGYYSAATPTEGPYKIEPWVVSGRGTYYIVTTYLKFDYPMIGEMFRVEVKGETKIVYGVSEGSAQCR